MPERRRDQPRRLLDDRAAMTAPNRRRRPLQVADRLPHRGVMRRAHARRAAPRRRARRARSRSSAPRTSDRTQPPEPGSTTTATPTRRADRARRAPAAAPRPRPRPRARARAPPRRSTRRAPRAADVVLLDPVADAVDHVDPPLRLVEVVLGLAGRELADRQHERVLDPQAAENAVRAIGLRTRSVGPGLLNRPLETAVFAADASTATRQPLVDQLRRYRFQANAKAEPCEGTRRRSVGAPTLCLCKTPGQEGLGRADAPRPTEKPGPRERDARSSPDASPCFGGRAKAAAC